MNREIFNLYTTTLLKSIWPEEKGWDFLSSDLREAMIEDENELIHRIWKEADWNPVLKHTESQVLSPFAFLYEKYTRHEKIKGKDFWTQTQSVPFALDAPADKEKSYLFPVEDADKSNEIDDLKTALRNFQFSDYKNDLFLIAAALLSLLETYLGTFPLQNQEITLYEFARLTAAAAVSLYINREQGHPDKELLFVKVDISGIQDYIFDVVSDGAAKSLKARSFRIQAISMMAVDYMVKTWGLSPANVVYNGGGVLILLIPESLEEKLPEVREKIAQSLIEEKGKNRPKSSFPYYEVPESLKIYIGAVKVSVSALGKEFGTYWEKVDEDLNQQRLCFYDRIDHNLVFTPLPAQNQTKRREAERDFFKKGVKRSVRREETRGYTGFNWYEGCEFEPASNWGNLAIAGYQNKKIIPDPYAAFHRATVFLDKKDDDEKEIQMRFNQPGIVKNHKLIQPQPFTYLVKDLPLWDKPLKQTFDKEWQDYKEKGDPFMEEDDLEPHKDHIIQFGHLAMFANQRTGTEKMAILKMDVDSLGAIFQSRHPENYEGPRLQEGRTTLAHTAYLSRALKWFFEGYINQLLMLELKRGVLSADLPEQDTFLAAYLAEIDKKDKSLKGTSSDSFRKDGVQKFIDNLYVVFSGGDDMLVVGAWDMVMEFAAIVQAEFEKFTQGRATISAGMILVSPKFPVSRFADLVKDAERKAKDAAREKNRICVFDQVLTWEEYRMARKLRNTLYYLVSREKENREPKALIQKIRKSMVGFEKLQEQIQTSKSIKFPRLWRLHYFLRGGKEVNQPVIKKEIIEYYDDLFQKTLTKRTTHNPALIAVAARWAEFMSRNTD
ncbi:MAG: type III-A CRISPR-associated protein Cas10/Csm1 [Bacteroidetes bacterium]|nr:type III-A CRISPR-associated protein Cas10/Csm1 [Bacteroidota bacterium]